ncbi:MAG: PDZ domain-containing protein [candidate division Zixibacteria bacterium]|nr:PDZ domain-containing protein [candidate division Zixibacteria bacterium]
MKASTLFHLFSITAMIWLLALSTVAGGVDPDLGPPPGSYAITSEDGTIRIPFELYRGDIRMNAVMQGRPVRMLIDNGFLWDELLIFGSPLIDSLNLKYEGEAEVGGGGEGNPVPSKIATGITIGFPGVEFYDQTAIVTPYSSGLTDMWTGTEGQVSATFLKHFVVDVNFDDMVMTLTEPDKFAYTGNGIELPMIHLPEGPWGIPATLEFDNGHRATIDLTMDLGDHNPLHLITGGQHNLPLPEKSLAATLGFGVQGPIHGHFGRVKAVYLGKYRLNSVLTGFVASDEHAAAFGEATVGLGLLQRFNFIYDYPSHRMFIEPNHTFGDPFPFDMSGLQMNRGGPDYLEVRRVYANSPAADAGIVVGDRVTNINGRPALDYDVWELRPIMRQEGSVVTLTVIRDEKKVDIPITLRAVL